MTVALGLASQRTVFPIYASGPDCGEYSSASRRPTGVELFAESPLLADHPFVWFSGRFGVSASHADVRSPVMLTAEGRLPDNTPYKVLKQYHLDMDLTAVTIAVGAGYQITPWLRASAEQSFTFHSASNQRAVQEIVEPLGAVFGENQSDVLEVLGPTVVAVRPVLPAIDLAAGGQLPLGGRWTLHPSVRASIPYLSLASNVAWREFPLSASLGLSFDLAGGDPARMTPPVAVDTPGTRPPAARRPMLTATIRARGIGSDGREYDDPVIEIEEAPWVEWVPVIPAIFFDSCSTDIPLRYVRLADAEAVERFRVDSLLDVAPLDIHRQMLNIVGERMRDNPASVLSIVGTTSGDETAGELIGLERAARVARYLHETWGIDEQRLVTSYERHLAAASPEETNEGRQENRRVELRLSGDDLSHPIPIRRTAAIATPPAVRFYPDVIADTTTTDWFVVVEQGGKELLRFIGRGEDTTIKKRWSIGDMRVNRDLTPISYRFVIHDVLGQTATASGSFRITERVRPASAPPRPELTEFSLVGFGYSSSELQPQYQAQLQQAARDIVPGADVAIAGYTDRVGDPARNRQLSQDRARAVLNALREIRERLGLGPTPAVSVLGFGGEQQIFDNNLPEGRLLSRMVRITISRPSTH